ncbi:MAG: hypothetical protein KGZ73_01330 [Rhizobiales bacterium]|nr:hypothetical protein [Hyphomicrobiales bacterium]
MIQAADYRARAEDCARRASEAQDEYHRKNFQALAVMWSEMADKVEGRTGAGTAAATPDEIDEALATIREADKFA